MVSWSFAALMIGCTACGRLHFDDRAADAPIADVVLGDVAEAASCLPSPLLTAFYATPTFADFATAWTTGGTGAWATSGGRLVQSDPSNSLDLAFAEHDVSPTDYRLVGALHAGAGGGTGRAVELALRVDVAMSNMIHCNWNATDGEISTSTSRSTEARLRTSP